MIWIQINLIMILGKIFQSLKERNMNLFIYTKKSRIWIDT